MSITALILDFGEVMVRPQSPASMAREHLAAAVASVDAVRTALA
jgi:hypothetical protein